MRTKPVASLACALTAGALILPACGNDQAPDDAEFAPADDVRVLEQRLGAVERQLRDLRQEIRRSQGPGERPSSDEPGDEKPTDRAADGGGASAPEDAGGTTRAASVTGSGDGGSDSGGGGGGSGGGSGASGGRSDAGGGPDPGSPEEDRSVEEICGPNPAPEC